MNDVKVEKYSGELEVFDINKLKNSLRRAQADESLVNDIALEIQGKIKDGMTTKKIYQMAFKLLKGSSRVSASRYKLKKAIMELGPSGFPFEKFIGKILEQEGFEAEVGVMVQGHCVQHEVDVTALKDNLHFMIECKYHSVQGRFCNVKVPLYIQSRFLDVEKQWKKQPGHGTMFHRGWVFTNTRFTSDAIKYGNCVGLMLVGWDYPINNGLKTRIDDSGLHPITSLISLTKKEKQVLLDKGIVLSKELCEFPANLDKIYVSKSRQKVIISEVRELCQGISK